MTSGTYIQQVCSGMKTCRKQWGIGKGGVKGSGISVLMARDDDDDDDDDDFPTSLDIT